MARSKPKAKAKKHPPVEFVVRNDPAKKKERVVRAWATLDDDGNIREVGTHSTALGVYRTKGGGMLLRPFDKSWRRVEIRVKQP